MTVIDLARHREPPQILEGRVIRDLEDLRDFCEAALAVGGNVTFNSMFCARLVKDRGQPGGHNLHFWKV